MSIKNESQIQQISTELLDSREVELIEPIKKIDIYDTGFEGRHIAVGVVDARKIDETGEPVGRTFIYPQSF